jgi:transcriptional regulator with GAF, ATPase, and Fis domain
MQEIEQLSALLNGWERAAELGQANPVLSQLELIRRLAPIQSILLQLLQPDLKSLKILDAVGEPTVQSMLGTSINLSDAKWSKVVYWCRTGTLLRQAGINRTGKLDSLTPDPITSEVFAVPLRPSQFMFTQNQDGETSWHTGGSDQSLGVAIFEIATGRSLREDQYQLLERWSVVLWFLLNRSTQIRRSEQLSSTPGSKVPASTGLSDQAKADEAREAIVGSESGLRAVMERVQIVATSDMPVLILGETGTGKEVVARAIHGRSPRSSQPFIRVNCGAIPPELIDSQLFGHERGSFTGASEQRKGWFERADGGTLFLDEIGELPLAAQVRLLRVLQEHQIERVGGQEHIHVNVRIVAATHRDLSAMVHTRAFREDLWYRINVFPILLPGLRERVEDIPALVRHFARRAADRFGLPYVEPSLAEIKQLMNYRWPGNIRELQAVIDRAVILGGGSRLEVALSLGNTFIEPKVQVSASDEPTYYEVVPESPCPVRPHFDSVLAVEEAGPVDSLDSAIIRHIERALAVSNGQIEGIRGAAQLLGINPHTLRAKMRKLSIDWNRFRR